MREAERTCEEISIAPGCEKEGKANSELGVGLAGREENDQKKEQNEKSSKLALPIFPFLCSWA